MAAKELKAATSPGRGGKERVRLALPQASAPLQTYETAGLSADALTPIPGDGWAERLSGMGPQEMAALREWVERETREFVEWGRLKWRTGHFWSLGVVQYRWARFLAWGAASVASPFVVGGPLGLTAALGLGAVAVQRAQTFWHEYKTDRSITLNPQKYAFERWEEIPFVPKHVLIGRAFNWTGEIANRYRNVCDYYEKRVDLRREEVTEEWDGDAEMINVGAGKFKHLHIKSGRFNRHCLIVGAPGSGKTVTLKAMVFNAIRNGGTVIFIDPKDDADVRDTMYQIYLIEVAAGRRKPNTFFAVEPSHPLNISHTYNPLKNYRDPIDVANRIMVLMGSSGKNAGDYFYKASESTAGALARSFHALGETPTIRKLSNIVLRPTDRQQMVEALRQKCPNSPVTKDVEAQFGMDGDVKKADRFDQVSSNLRVALANLCSDELDRILSVENPDVEWPRVFEEKAVVYVSTGALKNESVGRSLAQIITKDVLEFVAGHYKIQEEMGGKKLDAVLFIDEAAQAASDTMINALATTRGAGLSMVIAMQSLTDMAEKLGSEVAMQRVMASTHYKFCMKASDTFTPEVIVKYAHDVWEKSVEDGDQIDLFNRGGNGDGNLFKATQGRKYKREIADAFKAKQFMALPTCTGVLFDMGNEWVVHVPFLPKPQVRYLPKPGVVPEAVRPPAGSLEPAEKTASRKDERKEAGPRPARTKAGSWASALLGGAGPATPQ